MAFTPKRLTLLCGHYGSGKTNIAVNIAFALRNAGNDVTVADLDIVNPYFRTKDSESDFHDAGIRLICSEFAGSNVDLPSLPQELYAITDDKNRHFILDIGGDDRGALALGRITPAILSENNYEMLAVINGYRPLTQTPEDTVEALREIEYAGHLPFTAIINNSNLGCETTANDVLASLDYAEKTAKLMNLPLAMTTVSEKLFPSLEKTICNLFPLRLQQHPTNSNETR